MVSKKNDGKTRQQRYLEGHREKVNAANAKRNRERRIKRKLNNQCPAQTEPQRPCAPSSTKSKTPSPSTSNASATPLSPEALTKRLPDPTLLEDFKNYRERFKKFEDETGVVIDEYQDRSDFARGWVSKISYAASGLSRKVHTLEKEGNFLVKEGSTVLKRLSYSIDAHLREWEEASQAYLHTAGYLRVLDHIDTTYRVAYARREARRKAREEEFPEASE
ncbi:hypothetical protein CVT26_012251 [Gymnopilus dilepis]|uniref:Uncharacterized protein n=1 Tax=Gymnopilus dilepis TaxID=231916 RepID=A0A409YQ72_9AGAR|nr:hypothetical protein CVT26_012251 [Gymnopilus dilepis]